MDRSVIKSNLAMKRILYLNLLVCMLHLTACNEATSIDPTPTELHSIAYLKSLGRESATRIRQVVHIAGVVTANDVLGEWNRQLVLEDPSGGITLSIEDQELYRRYPIGARLVISCNSLTLYNYGGRIELGIEADAYGRTGLDVEAEARHILAVEPSGALPLPRATKIEEFTPQLVDCYLRIDNLRFMESGTWVVINPDNEAQYTEHTVEDDKGQTLTVRISPTAHYANEPLPEGKGSLYGILDYFNGSYALRVVHYGVDFR